MYICRSFSWTSFIIFVHEHFHTQVGSPAAPIQWFKDTKELSAGDDKYQMSHNNGVAKLQMVATELSDDDTYRVVAKNKVGEISSDAKLTVYSKYL